MTKRITIAILCLFNIFCPSNLQADARFLSDEADALFKINSVEDAHINFPIMVKFIDQKMKKHKPETRRLIKSILKTFEDIVANPQAKHFRLVKFIYECLHNSVSLLPRRAGTYSTLEFSESFAKQLEKLNLCMHGVYSDDLGNIFGTDVVKLKTQIQHAIRLLRSHSLKIRILHGAFWAKVNAKTCVGLAALIVIGAAGFEFHKKKIAGHADESYVSKVFEGSKKLMHKYIMPDKVDQTTDLVNQALANPQEGIHYDSKTIDDPKKNDGSKKTVRNNNLDQLMHNLLKTSQNLDATMKDVRTFLHPQGFYTQDNKFHPGEAPRPDEEGVKQFDPLVDTLQNFNKISHRLNTMLDPRGYWSDAQGKLHPGLAPSPLPEGAKQYPPLPQALENINCITTNVHDSLAYLRTLWPFAGNTSIEPTHQQTWTQWLINVATRH